MSFWSGRARITCWAASAPAFSRREPSALLDQVGAGARAHAEGLVHEGIELAFDGRRHRIDMKAATGKTVMIYGQTEVTLDLMDARKPPALPPSTRPRTCSRTISTAVTRA